MLSSIIQTPAWLRQMESILEELNEGVIIVDDRVDGVGWQEYESGSVQPGSAYQAKPTVPTATLFGGNCEAASGKFLGRFVEFRSGRSTIQ